jgi:hypothetical protein
MDLLILGPIGIVVILHLLSLWKRFLPLVAGPVLFGCLGLWLIGNGLIALSDQVTDQLLSGVQQAMKDCYIFLLVGGLMVGGLAWIGAEISNGISEISDDGIVLRLIGFFFRTLVRLFYDAIALGFSFAFTFYYALCMGLTFYILSGD